MVVKASNLIPCFPAAHLETIAKIIGDTEAGLTGSEIGHRLAQCKIPDPDPNMTKWKRLYNALAVFQNKHQVGNCVIVFINEVMNPALYTGNPELFQSRQEQLNTVLLLSGFQIAGDGKVQWTRRASTLDQVLERSNRMKEQLRKRNAHSEMLHFCDTEIIAQNNFHAVLEAMKSITSRIRSLSDLTTDGADLVQVAFSIGKSRPPLLAINGLNTETLRGEQRGFVNLLVGLYGMIRNPTAHEPKTEWPMDEGDALDILTIISFVHRVLDRTQRYQTI